MVYVEYVILDNLVIDWLLLWAAARTCRCYKGWLRTFLGAAFGTLFAVFMPFIGLTGALAILVKLLVGEAMVLMSCSFRSVGAFALCFLTFLAYTFASGGALFGIFYMLGFDFNGDYSSISTISGLPFGVILLGAILIVMLLATIFGKAKRCGDKVDFMRRVEISDGGKRVELNGIIDTGNSLYDARTGKPVSVIDKGVAEKLFDEGKLRMKGAHFVSCTTIHGEGKMLVFEIERMGIYCGNKRHIIDNAMIGVSTALLSGGTEMILHAGLF